ncbi:hypothetical protein F2Q69_00063647 [Brassica cretica]|uniref:3-beta hydroxysteroid dehydrogenase/isomerase domain-containing protein n=1 Tax=Brassica cretica TaxID=69181 RepID=A0A8S9RFP5_BRACR|nr:hypothetical protein F2Q69_00063647 [Brassica cretica]
MYMCVSPEDQKKTDHLLALDGARERLQLFKASLLEEGSFEHAIDGCDAVFHTASPVKIIATDPQGKVPRNKPRKRSVGILLSIDVYMSKHASIDELPRNYTDEVLPRYIPRTFPTN